MSLVITDKAQIRYSLGQYFSNYGPGTRTGLQSNACRSTATPPTNKMTIYSMKCLCLSWFAFQLCKILQYPEDFVSCSSALNKSCRRDSFVTQSTALLMALNYSSWEMTSSYCKKFIQLYKLAMVCSKQNVWTLISTYLQWQWMNKEPEAKNVIHLITSTTQHTLVWLRIQRELPTKACLCNRPNGSQQWSNETTKNVQTFRDKACTSSG